MRKRERENEREGNIESESDRWRRGGIERGRKEG